MSTDGSREIAKFYTSKIIDIPIESFDHGLSRNIGVQNATGELIFFTVQDAWLFKNDFIEKMASHFDDLTVKAVVGHQAVPHDQDKDPLLWHRPISAPSVTERIVYDKTLFLNLNQQKQQELIAWDNVVAMYRKEALIEQPFVQTAFAEDWIWSYQALLRGWKLLHDSSLVIYHYHHQSYKYAFKLRYTVNYHFYKFFGYTPVIPKLFIPIIKAFYHLLKNQRLSIGQKLYWFSYNIGVKLGDYISTLNFLFRLKYFGNLSIRKGFEKYCKQIPQGSQK